MGMCDIQLNFFKSTDVNVISSLLTIDIDQDDIFNSIIITSNSSENKLDTNYKWVNGQKNNTGDYKTYGGFVKITKQQIIIAYILPKVEKLLLKKKEDNIEKIDDFDTLSMDDMYISGVNSDISFNLKSN